MPPSATATEERELAMRCYAALRDGETWRPWAEKLLRRATAGEAASAESASRALFTLVVEPLADPFDPALSPVYREFFCWLIDACRRRPGFEPLDEGLRAVTIGDADALARRAEESIDRPPPLRPDRLRCIVLPSRVTLGADIAVISVLIAGLRRRFPKARILFAAGPKNLDLFAGADRLLGLPAPYPRGGSLRDRLAVWPALLRLLDRELAGYAGDDLLYLDPDSRMTQLGLLPFGPDDRRRLCYDSRAFGGDSDLPLAALTADWLDAILGPSDERPLPWTSFSAGADCRPDAKPLAAVSFGVGGNLAKRLPDPFERDAVDLLLQRGYRVALDRGFGPQEQARSEPLAAQVERAGGIVHDGSFRGFGEIVAAADLFLGYDSAFGHLAAGMGVRGLTVFAGAASARMLARWSPYGRGASTVIAVHADEAPAAVLERVRKALP